MHLQCPYACLCLRTWLDGEHQSSVRLTTFGCSSTWLSSIMYSKDVIVRLAFKLSYHNRQRCRKFLSIYLRASQTISIIENVPNSCAEALAVRQESQKAVCDGAMSTAGFWSALYDEEGGEARIHLCSSVWMFCSKRRGLYFEIYHPSVSTVRQIFRGSSASDMLGSRSMEMLGRLARSVAVTPSFTRRMYSDLSKNWPKRRKTGDKHLYRRGSAFCDGISLHQVPAALKQK